MRVCVCVCANVRARARMCVSACLPACLSVCLSVRLYRLTCSTHPLLSVHFTINSISESVENYQVIALGLISE